MPKVRASGRMVREHQEYLGLVVVLEPGVEGNVYQESQNQYGYDRRDELVRELERCVLRLVTFFDGHVPGSGRETLSV